MGDININKHIFKHPFTMCVAGSTGSGKTEWIMRFLKNTQTLVDTPIRWLLYCYGEINENIFRLKQLESLGNHQKYTDGALLPFGVTTHSGVPPLDKVKEMAERSGGRLLLILDDLMVGLKSDFLDVVFTRGSHNWGASVVLVSQHLFTKELRTARTNSHYLVLMRNPAGALQIRNLAVQLFPGQLPHFMEAYRDATKERFGYLLVDLHPKSDEEEKLKTNIYGEGEAGGHIIYYLPKNPSN